MSNVATSRNEDCEEMPRVSARRAATRERLAEAAIRIFARKGVEGATVEEICDEAGFTRGAFYSNFESKNALCIDVLQRCMGRTLEALTVELPSVTDTDLPVPEKLDMAIRLATRTVSGDPDTIMAINEIRLQAVRDPELRPAYLAFNSSTEPVLHDLVSDVIVANGVHLGIPVADLLSILGTLYEQQMIEAVIAEAPDRTAIVSEKMTTLLKALITE